VVKMAENPAGRFLNRTGTRLSAFPASPRAGSVTGLVRPQNAEIGRFPFSLADSYLIRQDTPLVWHVRRSSIFDRVLRRSSPRDALRGSSRNTAIVAARGRTTDPPRVPRCQRAADAVVAEAAICRLVLLCALVMFYLSWMLERKPNLADRLIVIGQPLPDEPDFLLYRMLTGLTEAITACIYAGRALP